MRTVRNKKPLPLGAMGLPTAAEFNVRLNTLRCKVLVFRKRSDLRKNWRKLLGSDIGPGCDGAVNDLCRYVEDYSGPAVRKWREVDRHYFAIMALHLDALGAGVLAHEVVHAALAYVRRVGKRNQWREMRVVNREETLAYPVGAITAQLVESLYRAGCYDGKEVITVAKKPTKKKGGKKC